MRAETFSMPACQAHKSCVIIQGFADRKRSVKTLRLENAARQKIFEKCEQDFKSCVIMEGFAKRDSPTKVKSKSSKRLRKNSKIFEASTKKRATMQGFADRSEVKQDDGSCLGFFKNIQPISVGV